MGLQRRGHSCGGGQRPPEGAHCSHKRQKFLPNLLNRVSYSKSTTSQVSGLTGSSAVYNVGQLTQAILKIQYIFTNNASFNVYINIQTVNDQVALVMFLFI